MSVGLFVRVEAKPGNEAEVATFISGAVSLAWEEQPGTTTWFALRVGPSMFGIFDTFPDEDGRRAHLSEPIAAALMAKASELLLTAPAIEKVEVRAAKLPG
jgi:quinol monooxygenase YgiN